jgi:hypothetical protein
MKNLEMRDKELGYEFKILEKQEFKNMAFASKTLLMQIMINIQEKLRKGINQTDVILLLGKYLAGDNGRDEVEMFNKLLIEANNDLNLIKFPKQYSKYNQYIRGLNIDLHESLLNIKYDDIAKKLSDSSRLVITNEGFDFQNDMIKKLVKVDKKEYLRRSLDNFDESLDNEELKNIPGIKEAVFKQLDKKTKSVFSFVMGDAESPIDLSKVPAEELTKMGGEEITEAELKVFEDGTYDESDFDDEKKEKLQKILEVLKMADSEKDSKK